MTISLTQEEKDLLHLLLEKFIQETKVEIHHTIISEFKEELHRKEDVAKTLLSKVEV